MNEELVRLHAQDCSFVASLWRRALDGPNYRLIDLYDLESRMRGHLDALVLAGDVGMSAAEEQLTKEAEFGETMVAAHLVLRNQDEVGIARLMGLAEGSAECAKAVAAAASLCSPADIAEYMRKWIAGASPVQVWIALEICGARRVDPGSKLLSLLSHPDDAVFARASVLAAENGREDLLPFVLQRLRDPAKAGFWAAWAGCLLGDRRAAPERLVAYLRPGEEPFFSRLAAELAPLAFTPDRSQLLVRRLLEDEANRRWAVVALGTIGTASSLDWLVRQMGDPLLARIAGSSFALITGGRLGPHNLERDVFPDGPDDPAVQANPQEAFIEANLYWPDKERVGAWLEVNRSRFRLDTRYLLGQPAWTHSDPQEAKYQLEFRAIALELAMRKPGSPLPNWRAPVELFRGRFTRRW